MVRSGYPGIILRPGRDESVRRFHPWIFSGAIRSVEGAPEEGQVVSVFNDRGEHLANGHYQPGSIAVRILTFNDAPINAAFWENRISAAVARRRELGLPGGLTNACLTNVCRLVHGEGDWLPGLVIDFFNGTAVVQFHSAGMYREREHICRALRKTLGEDLVAVYNKSEQTLPFRAGIEEKDGYLYGGPYDGIITENGLRFRVDWEEGQKTGFYIDQRDNRLLLTRYANDRTVLNLFGYTGGFSVYALHGGARTVDTVDASEKAISLADANVEINFGIDQRHRGHVHDAYQFLARSEKSYDLIILDPPAFAKHLRVLKNALQGYRKLNAKAMEIISPGGILFSFSCSQVVSREDFRRTMFTAATLAGRKASILHQLSQPADHPINIFHPEGEYLKGLVLRVE